MARTAAISMLTGATTPANLSEIYGIVIDNVKKDALSMALKSQLYTGNPAAGSCEFKRFVNATAKDYGTARTAGKGDKIVAPPTTVNLSVHREIVEEAAKFDLDTFGITNIMARRAINHIDTMAVDLDIAFFVAACAAATSVTPTEQAEIDQLEEVVQTLESVKNDYVQGVPRSMIVTVCAPAFYGKVRKALDTQPNSAANSAAEEFGIYHGIRVFPGINLPAGVKLLAKAIGSVAQPVVTYPYTDPQGIPLSNDVWSGLFYDYGTEVLAPDLLFKIVAAPPAGGQ